jgi:hypothetical protein
MSRLAAHSSVSTSLSAYSDHELRDLVDAAEPIGSGIGGTTARLNVGGTPVFVKRVPVTDLELRPENLGSTANLFELPNFCHYGVGLIGGPGFGAWRELATHVMTTNWVLAGDHEGFPLMYHWRVLPRPGQSLPEELADVEKAVSYWGGGAEIRRRIEAVRDASASIALFLEHVPHNLHDWLNTQVDAGDEALERACAMVEPELRAGTSFMNARGLLHFDVHFQNVLTDGERLYFADYGLAISSEFDLAPDEKRFFAEHQAYDRRYSVTHLVRWLRVALQDKPVPPQVAALLQRHTPVAEAMTDFYRTFRQDPSSQLSARFWNASSTSPQPPELSS